MNTREVLEKLFREVRRSLRDREAVVNSQFTSTNGELVEVNIEISFNDKDDDWPDDDDDDLIADDDDTDALRDSSEDTISDQPKGKDDV